MSVSLKRIIRCYFNIALKIRERLVFSQLVYVMKEIARSRGLGVLKPILLLQMVIF